MFFYTIISDLKDVNNEFGINILRNFANENSNSRE
jgi:hypothetical protein